MTEVFAPGGYRFIPAVFQYSGGVAAEPGFSIERFTFRYPMPLVRGFERMGWWSLRVPGLVRWREPFHHG